MFIGAVLRQRYKILQVLGKGGFGDTYLAEDLDLPKNHKCVVKHLKLKNVHSQQTLLAARRLFQTEAEALYILGDHDQIPKLFAHFEEDGEFYLVQEFIDGENLTKEIFNGNKLPEERVRKLLTEILEVVAVIHKHNIIHRDIKPPNIMRRYKDGKITLIDFGAVKEIVSVTEQIDSHLNSNIVTNEIDETEQKNEILEEDDQSNEITVANTSIATISIGSPGFMPSEQALGKPKLSSDVYAVGMLGIYALTGILPQELPKDSDEHVIWRECADVSDEFANILDKMVSYHFKERYYSATEALSALNPSPAENKPNSRRYFLKIFSFFSLGFGLAFVLKNLSHGNNSQVSNNYKTKPSPPQKVNHKRVILDDENINNKILENLKDFYFTVVKTDFQGKIISHTQTSNKHFIEDLGDGITLEMVQIPTGKFIMGSPKYEKDRFSDEGPQRKVNVPSFFLSKYPITQAQYKLLLNDNPSNFIGDQKPVERVTWRQAKKFCRLLSEKTGRKYRLPSEAEWEYACRANTSTPFYFGDSVTTDLVNYNGNYPYASAPKGKYRKKTTEVGQFPPNYFGLHDMSGNVWEWCEDCYQDSYQGLPNDGSPLLVGGDPKSRLLRGGSCYNYAWYCRSATRLRGADDTHADGIGFRIVLEVA